MPNLNRVLLMGRLTRDPDLRYTKDGTAICKFGLAVNRTFGTGDQRKEKSTFVDVTMWQRKAEVVAEYFKKGSPIFIEGRLELDQWENDKQEKRSKLYVVAENFEFLERGSKTAVAQDDSPAAASEAGSDADLPAPKEDDIPF